MRLFKLLFLTIGMLLSDPLAGLAQENWKKVIDLSGIWKFSIGDNKRWSQPEYNDAHWERIKVPSKWENEGFHGYDGYAWYRVKFNGKALKKSNYNLFLGYIDDIDQVFLNGKDIGQTGGFPPNYQTAFNTLRNYFMSVDHIDFEGENTIAVRVYDAVGFGGITSGDIGVFSNKDDDDLEVNLRGSWDFKLTNSFGKKGKEHFMRFQPDMKKEAETGDWEEIKVPGHWENQGYKHYNGGALYRKKVFIPEHLAGEDLVLILGKIDDYDKTYVNGKLIGSTDWYDKFRGYFIDASDINACEVNVIEIYVYDEYEWGGFSKGPIGILKHEDYTKFMRWRD